MSTCNNISNCVRYFLEWHQKELSPLSEGLDIIKNCFDFDAVTFSIYSSEIDDLSLFTQVPDSAILEKDELATAKINFEDGAARQLSENNLLNSKFCLSYWAKNKNNTKGFQVHLWYTDTDPIDAETQLFLDMACPLFLQRYKKSRAIVFSPNFVTEAFSSIADGFILYDKNQNILAFNNRQMELFPSIAASLEIGLNYKHMLEKQLEYGQIDIPTEDYQAWIDKRSDDLKIHGFTEEQEFENGTTIRLTNYRTPSGGTIAIRSDISELVAERQKAQENEELFRTLLVGAPIP